MANKGNGKVVSFDGPPKPYGRPDDRPRCQLPNCGRVQCGKPSQLCARHNELATDLLDILPLMEWHIDNVPYKLVLRRADQALPAEKDPTRLWRPGQ